VAAARLSAQRRPGTLDRLANLTRQESLMANRDKQRKEPKKPKQPKKPGA